MSYRASKIVLQDHGVRPEVVPPPRLSSRAVLQLPSQFVTFARGYSRSTGRHTTEEVRFGYGQSNLRGRHRDLYPDFALSIPEREARGGDLCRPVGPNGYEPGPDPLRGRGLDPNELAEQLREPYTLDYRSAVRAHRPELACRPLF